MKVAFVAPPFGQTGGPELTTTQIVDALVDLGVDVTLFAPADWITKAKHVHTLKESLWSMADFDSQTTYERRNLIISSQIKILVQQDEFDIIQLSTQRYAYAIADNLHVPCLLTLNNRLNKEKISFLKRTNLLTVAFTQKHKEEINANYHIKRGFPINSINPKYSDKSGLVVVGRIDEQKGIHVAIEIAKKANKKLTIVGRIGNSESRRLYYYEKIKPHIDGENIIHIEKLENKQVLELIANSEALLFTIIRPESFGRVQIEALACGTPVIGTKIDPLPEILFNDKVAFLSDNIDELVEVAKNTYKFDRKECRKFVEEYYDIMKEANSYLDLYEKILSEK